MLGNEYLLRALEKRDGNHRYIEECRGKSDDCFAILDMPGPVQRQVPQRGEPPVIVMLVIVFHRYFIA